jgi:sensor histidine kinase regulating citrate/malate metabolism
LRNLTAVLERYVKPTSKFEFKLDLTMKEAMFHGVKEDVVAVIQKEDVKLHNKCLVACVKEIDAKTLTKVLSSKIDPTMTVKQALQQE